MEWQQSTATARSTQTSKRHSFFLYLNTRSQSNTFLYIGYLYYSMGDVCQQCGNEYKSIGQHWSQNSSCSHPSFTNYQKEIITGLLMGDGSINNCGKNPYIRVGVISPNYLEYVSDQFGVLGGEVCLRQTAEESAKHDRDRGFSPNAKKENYSDVYFWQSMCHPELQKFADWYSSGKKVWPADIELTPTVLKHWYCGDGYWDNNHYNNHIRIAMANEIDNTDKVDQMFRNVGLPVPSNYAISESNCVATFTVEQSKELWKYMGEPLPDFEYKWPERFH